MADEAPPGSAGPGHDVPEGTARSAARGAGAPPAGQPDDTVSLRELYLVFRAGIPLIVGVALLCAVVAFAYRAFQGTSYTATAVVQMVRPRVSAQPSSGLEVSVGAAVDAGTYRAIAMSDGTLTRVAEELGLPGANALGAVNVTGGPGAQSGDAISVTHVVTVSSQRGADFAAEVANVWAQASVAAARDALTAPWRTAGDRVSADVAAREAAYQEASEAWADFLAVDEREELRRRLDALVDLDAARLARLGEVEAQAGGVRARRATLQGAGQAATDLDADLAALEAEAEHLRAELTASSDRADDLRSRLGELERRAAELQRRVSSASQAYFRAAPAEAGVELQRELAAGSVSLVIPAAAPLEPDPRGIVTTTVSAAIVGALATTLFVFLRAAVREPDAA